jgi:DNA invertase Pin-like site-specific DNA recombinase
MADNVIEKARNGINNSRNRSRDFPRRIGYVRVSKEDQRLSLQLDALHAARCDVIYMDHGVSGMKARRPEFDKAIDGLRRGDTIVVWKLDRMGRSLRHLVDVMQLIEGRGAHFECITDAIDTSTAMGKFFFHVMAALAELERELISERTRAGLEAARARGKRLGRPKKIGATAVSARRGRSSASALVPSFVRVA